MPANCGLSVAYYWVKLADLPTSQIAKRGCVQIEQLNIEGKRSGLGLVTHKAILVSALSRAIAERVMLMDITLGRKGFLSYLKAVSGSNIVKIVPSTSSFGSAQDRLWERGNLILI